MGLIFIFPKEGRWDFDFSPAKKQTETMADLIGGAADAVLF